jgi:hypothetical protein
VLAGRPWSLGALRELYFSERIIAALDEGWRVVRRQRAAVPYKTVTQAVFTYEAMLTALEGLHRPKYEGLGNPTAC